MNGYGKIIIGVLAAALVTGLTAWLLIGQNAVTRMEVQNMIDRELTLRDSAAAELRGSVNQLKDQVANLNTTIMVLNATMKGTR